MRKPILHNENQRGQAIVLIAAVMVALIAALGLAIDGGGLFLLYRDVQNATDSAALTAAFALCAGEPIQDSVENNARENGFENGVRGTVTINNPPVAGTFAGNPNYVTVEIVAEKPSYFIQIVYPDVLTVRASTTSQCQPANDFGFPTNSALVELNVNSCKGQGNAPLDQQGNSSVYISGNIYINHASGSCESVDILGNASANFFLDGDLCVQGTDVSIGKPLLGSDGLPADVYAGCTQVPQLTGAAAQDPLGLSANPPSCAGLPSYGSLNTFATSQSSPVGVAQPGTYADLDVGSNRHVELAPGVYCTNGGADLKGTITSQPGGVTIYQDCGTCVFKMNAQAELNLEAQQAGDFAGLLLYSTSANQQNGHEFTGQANLQLTGTIYAPQAKCSAAGGNNTVLYAQFICYQFGIAGNGELKIFHLPSTVYQVPSSFGITE